MADIAVFGGTFNPFHIGHYQILRSLCEMPFIDKVLVMPDNIPPHKECDFLASDRDRINMCQIACLNFPKAEVCTIEFEREEKSYTFDTINELKAMYPDDTLYFVCGADMIETLDTWYNFDKLKTVTKFIAFNRGKDKHFLKNVEKMRSLGAEIVVSDAVITDISSSRLRKGLLEEYFPKNIFDYLKQRNIYNGQL